MPYAMGLKLPLTHTVDINGTVLAVNNTNTATSSPTFLVQSGGGNGITGKSTGASMADNGVYGETNSPSGTEAGVRGHSTDTAAGGSFSSVDGYGVYATSTNGTALQVNGNAKQSLAGNGFVKAGAFITNCGPTAALARSFNNVNTTAMTVTPGAAAGQCSLDLGFDASTRFVAVTVQTGGAFARHAVYYPGATTDVINIRTYTDAGALNTEDVMVIVY